MQTYDPHHLISDVQGILRDAGIDPHITDDRLALTGACMLLRALGSFPAIDPVDAYTRTLDTEPWPEADDRNAEAFRRQASLEHQAGLGGSRPGQGRWRSAHEVIWEHRPLAAVHGWLVLR